jgi:hypothetical protein
MLWGQGKGARMITGQIKVNNQTMVVNHISTRHGVGRRLSSLSLKSR